MAGKRCRHAMPFGAELEPGGATRFRLWAPAARRVDLLLASPAWRAELPLEPLADGWHERSAAAPAGSRYAYRIDGGMSVPDPASRANPDDVHAPSLVVDPLAFEWQDAGWTGRPWEEAVLYELHVGTFTPQGTFAAALARLDELAALGVTALELMPVADFPGRRNWGYDGVLPFAPEASYGPPDDLKRLVQEAHARGLMVLLDVVYNHFGPEGNYLHLYAPQFFNPAHATPWGAAINFDGAASRTVREFFLHNALYWVEEFRFDGLRLDAVHAIRDASDPDIVTAIGRALAAGPGRERHVHLVLENDRNDARYLERDAGSGRPQVAAAQWNDDVHHALHLLVTGESDGYYADYADAPLARLGRALAEGFAWQGEPSAFRGGARRGTPSAHLPATAFIAFLQTHDQVGNRAFGERLAALAPPAALAAAEACVLLSPQVPRLVMGAECGLSTPFLFFCDFGPELAAAVARGRREEFAQFAAFRDPAARSRIPDPGDAATFAASRPRWDECARPPQRERRQRIARLLGLRRRHLVPRLAGMGGGRFVIVNGALHVEWQLGDGTVWHLALNFSPDTARLPRTPRGARIYGSGDTADGAALALAPCGIYASLEQP
jgi:maltooligosyltrehalose trehalohydrolase